ncbi:hypothetical protein [Geobacter argillaceus]|uniref:Uncharacterized protein n=1 Tax=Geobacter argillaceus TaxID=345631 RepID=A0A562WSI9_9BACT|nr:hypothetical protein [Geobacter argillaceus]TWJ33407.1 hypothetical protein JN12_00080 [Geobacter argillaceus]
MPVLENLLMMNNRTGADRQTEQEQPADQQTQPTGWGILADKATTYGEKFVDQLWQQHMAQALARGRYDPAQYPVEINIDYQPGGATPVYGPTLQRSDPKIKRYLDYLGYRGGY